MELLHEPRTARKVLLLQDSQSEVLVLSSARLTQSWKHELVDALKACARRGLKVKLLLDAGRALPAPFLLALLETGAQVRQARTKFSWLFRARAVQGEIWIFDRGMAITANQRVHGIAGAGPAMNFECLLGPEVAAGAAKYFDLRWEAEASPMAYSVRHKNYAFHSGAQAEHEFFGCLIGAKKSVTVCLPGSRLSKRVEAALHASLRDNLAVTIYANAESSDAPALRRLRRLAAGGASVKICGRRLRSEFAVVDSQALYLGSLPGSWRPLSPGSCPVFLVQDGKTSLEILEALENQVSVEINGQTSSSFYAYR